MAPPLRVIAIIPALDEEATMGQTVAGLDRVRFQEVIVVDNGSCHRTTERASAAGARVVFEPRRGYGTACLAGVRAAGPDGLLVCLDGDGSDVPEEAARVVEPIRQGTAHLVLGSRRCGRRDPRAFAAHQRWGNWLVPGFVRLLYGVHLTDLGPFRAIHAATLARLGMSHPTYGWPIAMMVKAARQGLRITEVPVRGRRRGGRSKVAGTLRGSLLAGSHLLGTVFRYAWRPRR